MPLTRTCAVPHPLPAVSGRRIAVAAAALTAALGLAGCTSGGGATAAAATVTASPSSSSTTTGGSSASGQALPALVHQLEPSVVTIFTSAGLGSGVVYKADGTIVTNEHVVRDATNGMVIVGFADGQRVTGKVLAADPLVDVAVVKVNRNNLPTPAYRTDLPQVGEEDVVIGSPLGLSGTVTSGIISGLHRDLPGAASQGNQALADLIQTDAPISPGNSGGAVLDMQGRVIGLSEAYIPPSAGAVALGFAIPAATVTQTADQLIATGRAKHAFLGVVFGTLTPQIAQQLGVTQEGALVLQVQAGGPAAKAGLQPGDVITAIGGTRVRSSDEVLTALRQRAPGDQVTLTLERQGTKKQVTVTLGDRP